MPLARVPKLALTADVVAVVVFAAVGRLSHAEPDDLLGLLGTVAPFAVALAVAWTVPAVRAQPHGFRAGVVALVGTVVLGLALRTAFTGHLPPLSFAVVTIVVLTVLLLGWRALAAAVSHRMAHRVR